MHLGLSRWPVEAEDKLPDRNKCRVKVPLAELIQRSEKYNAELEEAHQPTLVKEELIAANLYTGPVRPTLQTPCCCVVP